MQKHKKELLKSNQNGTAMTVAAGFSLRFLEQDHTVTTQAEACGYLKILEFRDPKNNPEKAYEK